MNRFQAFSEIILALAFFNARLNLIRNFFFGFDYLLFVNEKIEKSVEFLLNGRILENLLFVALFEIHIV